MALDPASMQSACPESTIFGVAMREEPETWYQIIERLEQEATLHAIRDSAYNRRQGERHAYRTKTAIQIRSKLVTSKANPWNTFRAYTRNVSEHGASLLLDSFIHAGTTCRVLIRALNDKGLLVPGEVKFCKYVGHGMHEVGVSFRVRLPLEMVLESAVPELPVAPPGSPGTPGTPGSPGNPDAVFRSSAEADADAGYVGDPTFPGDPGVAQQSFTSRRAG